MKAISNGFQYQIPLRSQVIELLARAEVACISRAKWVSIVEGIDPDHLKLFKEQIVELY